MTKGSRDRTIATIGIDIGKNSFHLIGMDAVGARSATAGSESPSNAAAISLTIAMERFAGIKVPRPASLLVARSGYYN